jgi:hypothetical protein
MRKGAAGVASFQWRHVREVQYAMLQLSTGSRGWEGRQAGITLQVEKICLQRAPPQESSLVS